MKRTQRYALGLLLLSGCGRGDFTTSETDSGMGGALTPSEPTEGTPNDAITGGHDSGDDDEQDTTGTGGSQPGATGGGSATGGAWYGNVGCPEGEACEATGGVVSVTTGGTASGGASTGGASTGPPQCGDGDCPHWQDSDAQTGGQCVSEIYNLNYEEWTFREGKSWDLNCGPYATSQYCWDRAKTNNYERCP